MAEEENELKLPSDLRMCTTAHTQINIIKLKKKKKKVRNKSANMTGMSESDHVTDSLGRA